MNTQQNFYLVRINTTAEKGSGVFANRAIKQGEIVIISRPMKILTQRTKYSLQIDWNMHIELNKPAAIINHSCVPNTGVQNNTFSGYSFIALRDIRKDEEITWDYATTEYGSLVWNGLCMCHAKTCRKQIKGYKYTDKKTREKFGNFIADYLKK